MTAIIELEGVIRRLSLDIDGDGHMDLFVLRVGGNLLLKGGPDCLSRSPTRKGLRRRSRLDDVLRAEWSRDRNSRRCDRPLCRPACAGSPWGTCEDNSLYRPQPGDKPDYSVRTPLAPGFCALSMLFTDWNRSGVPSLRVSNDRQYYAAATEADVEGRA